MKKAISILLMMVMVLSISVTTVLAEMAQGANFVDENKDGVCDLCVGTGANNDGICDNCMNNGTRPMDGTGKQLRRGNAASGNRQSNFVDANGDGVCDNAASNQHGSRFIDANGDGICDNRTNSGRRGNGTRGNGRGGKK